jgi:hypothetical protein
MQCLTNIARVTREMMFLESEMLLGKEYSEYAWFIEHGYGGDASNWWLYGPECTRRMVRAAGFRQADFQGWVWRPGAREKTVEGFARQGRGVVLCYK